MMSFSVIHLLLGLLLLFVPCYLLYLYDRLTLPKVTLAVVRMMVQMTAMGACLWALFRFDSVWLCLLWLVVLVVAAAFLLVSRVRIKSRILFLPVSIAMFVSVLTVSLYLIYVVLYPAASLSARWFVPLTGVLMAHSLMTNIQALRTYYNCLQQDSLPYYTLLGNGASRPTALAPYITRALKSMVMPTIANLSAMGLFVMPMLLSGMLLGGMNALEAVSVFVVLMLACIATALLSLILTLVLADRRSFNRQGQLESVFTVD